MTFCADAIYIISLVGFLPLSYSCFTYEFLLSLSRSFSKKCDQHDDYKVL